MKTKLITAIVTDLMLYLLFPHYVLHHALGIFMLVVFVISAGLLYLLSRPSKKVEYKIAGEIAEEPVTENRQTSSMIPVDKQELEQLVEILKGLGYKAQEARITAQNAMMNTEGNFQDKVRKAVQMLDRN